MKIAMQIDIKKQLQDLKKKRGKNRQRATLYFDAGLFTEFKALCKDQGGISASKVIEEWMRIALAEAKKK